MKWLLILYFIRGTAIAGQFDIESDCHTAALAIQVVSQEQALGQVQLLMVEQSPVAAYCVQGQWGGPKPQTAK